LWPATALPKLLAFNKVFTKFKNKREIICNLQIENDFRQSIVDDIKINTGTY